MTPRPYYDHFRWQASIPFDCPLCGVHIPPGVVHECSNPKPKSQKQPSKHRQQGSIKKR